MSRPTIQVQATGDRTPLPRIEVVKDWIDAMGRPQERVVTVAGSAMNGASVDTTTCTATPGMGTMTLCGVWTDDQYDPALRAAYYARVLENPTCRWSTPVCNALPATAPMESRENCTMTARTIQDRAWTSPVWSVPAR
jgi:hypothetical protein